ncbi:3-oxo-5-alpha-steroid 4-dehydrogenase [Yamadazyma tenuis]|uniref:3-oxo-5-alpha-steroid 4-dehydrogenase n=1 Tax=Candida tenuis TaxID=2315449 RepID=UPI00279C0016|nr:3-oxo-5-alpha-steroid 4-dehydrogenase [Yamadazyma tenuis]
MDSIKHILVEQVNSNIMFFKLMYELLSDFTIDHWVALLASSLLMGLIIASSENVSSRIVLYGKNYANQPNNPSYIPQNIWERVFVRVHKITVPKKYFLHFYVFFALLMVINAFVEWNFNTNAFPQVNDFFASFYERFYTNYLTSEQNYKNLYVISNLLMIQSFRRLYECLFVSQFSDVSMNILHYVFGLSYYWMVASVNFGGILPYYIYGQSNNYKVELDMSDWLFIGVFLTYSMDQFQNHQHLAKLVKYTIPSFRLFEYCASPHYLDEIIFQTYKYYQDKFKEKFKIPYKLVPFVW